MTARFIDTFSERPPVDVILVAFPTDGGPGHAGYCYGDVCGMRIFRFWKMTWDACGGQRGARGPGGEVVGPDDGDAVGSFHSQRSQDTTTETDNRRFVLQSNADAVVERYRHGNSVTSRDPRKFPGTEGEIQGSVDAGELVSMVAKGES